MLNILYEFTYLPLNFQVAIATAILLLVVWFKLPSVILSLCVLLGLWLYMVELPIFVYVGIGLALFTLPFIRAQLVSRLIMNLAIKFKVFPKVSSTEQAALDAGSVWMDRELFSGSPNISTMMNQEH